MFGIDSCWEKAVRYLDVEEKFVYCTETRFVMDPKEAIDLVDENVRDSFCAQL